MFWRVSGLNTASPVDAILDKEDYSLEELLDEDELIQECKSLNSRLTTFLKQRDTVERLVGYLVEDAPGDADAKRQFKYPFAACEIFCCEVEGVYNTLLENDELLDRLFSLVDAPRPLNTMLAGYFARVVGSLLLRRSADLMQYLQRRRELLPKLVHHVDTTSVAEVLARLVGADDPQGYPSAAALTWLAGTDLLGLLVDALGPSSPAEGQANAAEVLAAVARSAASPLTRSMASAEFMERLVDAALAPHDGRAATHALNVCIALLDPVALGDPTMMGGGGPVPPAPGSPADVHEQLRTEAIRCVSAACERLVALLDDGAAGSGPLHTSYGLVPSPVGQLRLKAVDLIAALLRTADPVAEAAVMRTAAVQRAMDLFLAHPFNNALHGGVAALLTSFEGGTDALREWLLREAKLVDWLIAAPIEVRPMPNPDVDGAADEPGASSPDGSDAAGNGNAAAAAEGEGDKKGRKQRPPLRAGYCGHLTQIANRLAHLGETNRLVHDFLQSHNGWQEHVRTRLEPRNKLESVFAWACGRPATLGGDHLAGDAALYQGDVSFSSLDASSFSREVYQRYGVYGDDDDDEEDGEGTPPEWVMELPGAGDAGKLGAPGWAGASGGGAAGSSEANEEEGGAAGAVGAPGDDEDAALEVGGLGPDTMADMQDDAVVLEDVEAAEGLVSLQGEMEALSVADGNGPVSEEAAAEAEAGEKAEDKEEEEPAAQEFNSNVFWKPTFEVEVDEVPGPPPASS